MQNSKRATSGVRTSPVCQGTSFSATLGTTTIEESRLKSGSLKTGLLGREKCQQSCTRTPTRPVCYVAQNCSCNKQPRVRKYFHVAKMDETIFLPPKYLGITNPSPLQNLRQQPQLFVKQQTFLICMQLQLSLTFRWRRRRNCRQIQRQLVPQTYKFERFRDEAAPRHESVGPRKTQNPATE